MKYLLDKNYIMRLASNPEVARRGVDYFNHNRVKLAEPNEDEPYTVYAEVMGRYDSYDIIMEFDRYGILRKTGCNCKNSIWRGACKHVVASLLQLYTHERSISNERNSRLLSEKLLTKLEKETYGFIDNEIFGNNTGNRVALTPFIGVDTNGFGLFFKLGRKRHYVLKNVTEFLNAVLQEKTVTYGKNLEFGHSMYMFDEFSRKLISLMLKEHDTITGTEEIRVQPRTSVYEYQARCFRLSKTGLDAFFDLIYSTEKKSVPSFANEMQEIFFSKEAPLLKFNLGLDDGYITLGGGFGSRRLFEGYEKKFMFEENRLIELSSDMYSILRPISELFKTLGTDTIRFDKNEKQRFIGLLYPKLRDLELLNDNALNTPYDEMEVNILESRLYFDNENGSITLKVIFCYGNDEINPLDREHQSTAVRNAYDEYRLLQCLKLGGFLPDEQRKLFVLSSNDLIYSFIHEGGFAALSDMSELYTSETFRSIAEVKRASASVGIRLSGDLLAVDIDTNGIDRDELLDLLYSYELKKKYYRLKNGAFLKLDENRGIAAAAENLESMGLSSADIKNGECLVPKYRALALGNMLADNGESYIHSDSAIGSIADDILNFKEHSPIPPDSLTEVLRNYQKEGFSWLSQLSRHGLGGILADDMGLGKTLQIISLILSEKNVSKKPSLVVTPTSLIYNWEKEIQRFAPELTVSIITGPASKRRSIIEDSEKTNIYITTYDTLKRDIDCYNNISFRYVVADEAQAIKNPLTQNAQAIKQIDGEVRLALTGTPIQNTISELWSIFDFIMPGFLYDFNKFSKQYEQPIIKHGDKQTMAALRKQIAPFIMRRVKSDVLKELPDKIETTLYSDMTAEQRKLYTAYLMKAKGVINLAVKEKSLNKRRIDILAQLTRLRQICCDPSTFIKDYNGGSGKLDLTLETIKDAIAAKHRILVFSQFTAMLDIIENKLSGEHISHFYLRGSTGSKERMDMTERFNSGEKRVFLISLKAGGSGLNLTGADVVLHYDPWWNPAVMDQATDRAHRIGQKNAVQVINIVAKDSVEEKILKMQSKKKDLINNVIQEGAVHLNRMTKEELLELFDM